MGQFDPFDNEFRQRANSIRRTPSPRAWNQLEHRLDRKGRTATQRFIGLRPWMIAALLLLIAGTVGISLLTNRPVSPLAQRSQSVEDLNSAFSPSDNFDVDAFRTRLQTTEPGTPDPDSYRDRDRANTPAEFRDLTVAEKYRS
ncbi:hypothetical protein [Neolewinella antarctica]|uniref:Uncharacterized protein n=1 Tax=Neolewinella antarctica TaxID=442734 RepID=A0ABX0X621_9BACT|nr:hypothetical protein [Neolewinella antarctica]NJC24654.1 hypothetical protein [Neolewinella antarctica]